MITPSPLHVRSCLPKKVGGRMPTFAWGGVIVGFNDPQRRRDGQIPAPRTELYGRAAVTAKIRSNWGGTRKEVHKAENVCETPGTLNKVKTGPRDGWTMRSRTRQGTLEFLF